MADKKDKEIIENDVVDTPSDENELDIANRQNSFGGSLSDIFSAQRKDNASAIKAVKVEKKLVKAPPVSSQSSMYGGLGAVMRDIDAKEKSGELSNDEAKVKAPVTVKNTSSSLGALGKAFVQNDKEKEKDPSQDIMPDLKKNEPLIVKHDTNLLGALGKAFDDQDLNNGKLTEENKQIKKEDHETEQLLGSLGSVFNNINRKK